MNFGIIGVGGFVAPRHLAAIRKSEGKLLCALDVHDSVGVLDSYFPQSKFFIEFERFDRYVDKLRREGNPLDYLVICSPNYLHDSHCRYGLRVGCNVICEKPLVVNPWNLESMGAIEAETGLKVYSILQLRLHPAVRELKEKLDQRPRVDQKHRVKIDYVTPRGEWYFASWKGDETKSGGLLMNIGIHLFDLAIYLFGGRIKEEVTEHSRTSISGLVVLERAEIEWRVSVSSSDLGMPDSGEVLGGTYVAKREFRVDGEQLDLSVGFTDLHVASYSEILSGNGFGSEDARGAIDLVHALRNQL